MKIGFIGAGKMAEAIVSSLVSSKTLEAHEIFASDVSAERRELMKKKNGINLYSKNDAVVAEAAVIFLAVKPQDLGAVLTALRPGLTPDHLLISIAAGKTLAAIESLAPESRVVRVMPNMASVVGAGMSVFCAGHKATRADRKLVSSLLACFSQVIELPEEKFDAVTALSGSGPAFFACFLDYMVAAGVREGLAQEDALLLAEQTMLGASRLLLEMEMTPRELIQAVASPKGTTAAGLDVLEQSDVADVVSRTLAAAAERSRELRR